MRQTIHDDVSQVLQKLVIYCEKDDITFSFYRGNTLSRSAFSTMITDYIRTCYDDVKEK